MPPRTNECPVDGCSTRHPTDMLMCKRHWWTVPQALRDAVWRTYREEGVFSEAYMAARDAAIASVTP